MKKLLLHSIIFSLALLIIYYGTRIGIGFIQTLNHVPEIGEVYQSVNYQQSAVAFGKAINPLRQFVEALVLFVAGVGLYLSGSYLIRKYKTKNT